MPTRTTFKNRIVRDLAWTILSPPLVQLDSSVSPCASIEWCEQQYLAFLPKLLELDNDPTPILERIDLSQSFRLGKYFENLIAFWLSTSDSFDLLEHNLQIRDGKETLGEMDFVVFDRELNKTSHWEVAVKFYLGFPTNHQLASWHGPGKRDNLARKMGHLTKNQLKRSEHPVAAEILRQKGHQIDHSFLFVKGRLFHERDHTLDLPNHPDAASASGASIHHKHVHSWWCRAKDFVKFADSFGLIWRELQKPNWLVDQSSLDISTGGGSIESLVEIGQGRPVYVVGLEGNIERDRGFVVPDNWSDELAETPE